MYFRFRGQDLQREAVRGDFRPPAHGQGMLDGILQLTNIPRPFEVFGGNEGRAIEVFGKVDMVAGRQAQELAGRLNPLLRDRPESTPPEPAR